MQRKGPLPGKIFALCIPERRFAGLFGCTARISCQSRPVSDAWRRYSARKGRFSRPRPPRERMKRKSRHGSPPGNASRRYLATVGRRGNAFREHFAIGERPGTRPRAGPSAAGGHPATGRASAARPYGCGWAPRHGAGLSAASWTTDSGTICCEPPFNRKNKHHAENKNEPVHSDISPLLYSYRFYLLRNKYLALESTHL